MPESLSASVAFQAAVPSGFRLAAELVTGPGLPFGQSAEILGEIPLGRAATADEIATMASFCALDAPASMTGAVIDANGASYVR